MGPTLNINKQTKIENEQEWKIPKKVCKDHNTNNSSSIPSNSSYNRIGNATHLSFYNESVQDNSKQVTQNIEKKKIYEVKKGNSEKVIPQQCSILKTQDVGTSKQANVNLNQEWENKPAKDIEVELRAKMLRLEFQIQKLSNDFIKASKESESKTEKCESLQIECELLKNELEEKDNELEQRANSEREYKVELCALEQECLRNQEKAENLISNLENKLKMQVERSEIEKEILEKTVKFLIRSYLLYLIKLE